MGSRRDLSIDLLTLTTEQLRQVLPQVAKQANSRRRALQQADLTEQSLSYKITQNYLKQQGLQNFSQSVKGKSPAQIRKEIRAIQKFLDAETSTVTNVRKLQRENLAKATDGVFDNNTKSKYYTSLNDFLSSMRFSQLSQYTDSKTLAEDFASALKQGYTEEQIIQQYEEFINTRVMTFEQIQEKRDRGEYV